jgi:calcineurin-like phosphoesterase
MTGPTDSVIGVKKDQIINKFLTHIPVRFETAKGETLLSCIVLDVNSRTGTATSIQRLQFTFPE